MVASLGCCCWPGRRVPQTPDCWSSCNIWGKMSEGGEDDDKGMVNDVKSVRSLGGTETLRSMKDGICESGDKGCGWCGDVDVVEVVCGVRMGVAVGGVRATGNGVVSSGGSVSVADGGGAR